MKNMCDTCKTFFGSTMYIYPQFLKMTLMGHVY